MKKIIAALTLVMCLLLSASTPVWAASGTCYQTMKKTEIPYLEQITATDGDMVVYKNATTEALYLATLSNEYAYFACLSTDNKLYAHVDNIELMNANAEFVIYELAKDSTEWIRLQSGTVMEGWNEYIGSLDLYTIVYCDSDIKNIDTDTVFFSALTSLEKVAREANWMSLLTTLKPLIVPITIIVVSWVAFRKGWSFLKTALHQA